MIDALLLAMFLRNFTVDETPPPATPTFRELRREEGPASLTVEIKPMTGGAIPPGAGRIKMLELKMSASCGGADVSVKEIKLIRRGLGDYRDILRVYAISENRRPGPSQQLNRKDGLIELRMSHLTVESCKEKIVDIYADFSGNASVSGEHRFIIAGAGNIIAAAKSIALIQGKEIERASDTKKIAGEEIGQISITYLPLTKRVTYGANRTVMRFSMKADGLDSHRVLAITIKNRGSARNLDLQNISLQGTKVESSLEGDNVRLVFDPPLMLEKNQERLMIMKADVRASRRRTIDFIIEEPSDIESEIVSGRSK